MVTPCPTPDVLRRYFLGTDLGPETAPVEAHLADCPRCVEALHALRDEDALVSALRGQGGRRLSNPLLSGLQVRLRQLPWPSAASQPTPASGHGNTPPADLPFPVHFLAPPRTPGELGRLDEYRVLAVLGKGGMGVVFRAEDEKLQRPVALKVMHPQLAASPEARERFLREARLAASLGHEHVVTVYRAGEDRGVLFLAMPLLEGETLEDRLKRGLPTLGEALRIAREAAEGLAAAHARGLIHRDIKPANLFLEGEPGASATGGCVKVLDFGLARPVDADGQLTHSGIAVGTPAYMAPEQISGQAEQRSDLFSLGCVLYRMLTGQLAFDGSSAREIFLNTLNGHFRPVRELAPSVPVPVANTIHKLLAAEPSDRPVSAAVVATVLRTLQVRHAPDPAAIVPPDGPTVSDGNRTVPRTAPRRRRLLVIAAAAGLLLAAAVGVGLALRSGDRQQPGEGTEKERGKEVASRDTNGKGATKKDRTDGNGKGTGTGEEKKEGEGEHRPPDPPPDQPLPRRERGPALSDTALVTEPERVRGVDAWDLQVDRRVWSRLNGLEYAADGQLLLTAADGKPYRFDPARPALTALPKPAPGPADDGFVWSPDRKTRARLAGLEADLFDADADKPRLTLQGPVKSPLVALSWSPSGKVLVGVEERAQLWIWEPETGKRDLVDLRSNGPDARSCRFEWAGDSRWLIVNPGSGTNLIDMERRRLIDGSIGGLRSVSWAPAFRGVVHTGTASSVVAYIHTLPDGKFVNSWGGLSTAAAWSPSGNYVAIPRTRDSETGKGVVELINTQTWQTGKKLACREPALHLAFSPDGKTLAAFTAEQRLLFWDVKEGRLLGTFVLLPEGRWLAWSADGHYCGADGVEAVAKLKYDVKPEDRPRAQLPPEEFGQRFGWKNEPERVRLRAS